MSNQEVKVVVVDELPEKSLHFKDFKKNDELVKETIGKLLLVSHSNSLIKINRPKALDDLLTWTKTFIKESEITPDVEISNPTKKVYQIHQYTDDKDIYFFTNVHRFDTTKFNAKFPVEGKYPYVWNPETGERKPYYYASTANELAITLNPLESLLLVFEDEKPSEKALVMHMIKLKIPKLLMEIGL